MAQKFTLLSFMLKQPEWPQDKLENFLQKTELSKSITEKLFSRANILQAKKREILIRPGGAIQKIFYIDRGLLRAYRITDGVDVTHHFFAENWFGTDYESFLTSRPGSLYIECMTDSIIYEFDKTVLENLCAEYPKLEKVMRKIAEVAFLTMVERYRDFQTGDLKSRYQKFENTYPEILLAVPQKHIASYLGVAPQSLSRLRKNLD